MEPRHIRNFCIIAHIDHGKSTLADRLLQVTGSVSDRDMMEQFLDSMSLERERGITIKAHPVRIMYTAASGQQYQLNLIDTPGHVDFTYEVSRSLAACEGALLVVDATQGIQAQTLANVYLALDRDMTIIPVVNKIDLKAAEPERVAAEVCQTFGFRDDEVIFASGKDGTGVIDVLEAVVKRVPPPKGEAEAPFRALIFDSHYDSYKGVVAYVRVFDGSIKTGTRLRIMAKGSQSEAQEVGIFRPQQIAVDALSMGEVGYIATGLKAVRDAPVGDTVTQAYNGAAEPLAPYRPMKPMVFAGFYPSDGEEYGDLRESLEKLQLNDAAFSFQPEQSVALGPGFRCGFLGLLHMDIVQERLEREYNLDLLATAPSVAYQVTLTDGTVVEVDNPAELPETQKVAEIAEPWLNLTILAPDSYIGAIMELVTTRRGEFKRMEYIQAGTASTVGAGVGTQLQVAQGTRVMLEYSIPLSEVLVDFIDQLKSRTQGYASMDYELTGYRAGKLVKLDILVNAEPVDALSVIVHRDRAFDYGKQLTSRLKDLIPRQMFEVPIQAAIGGKILARESIRAIRKDVLAKCYGGDVTRKRKLLEKQAEGKKRMRRVGRVEIPQEAFLSILKMNR
ncbi:MAG: elongation factor 4 [SAR202 cluster bacterium]|nr:elongation factor 4 [SAR202 cluster bacterium]